MEASSTKNNAVIQNKKGMPIHILSEKIENEKTL